MISGVEQELIVVLTVDVNKTSADFFEGGGVHGDSVDFAGILAKNGHGSLKNVDSVVIINIVFVKNRFAVFRHIFKNRNDGCLVGACPNKGL